MFGGWNCKEKCPRSDRSHAKCCKALPLADAPAGKVLKVSSIEGGRHLCARMAAMGIYPGAEMEVLCSGCGSPCLVRVRGGTLSLGEGVSQNIFVTSVA